MNCASALDLLLRGFKRLVRDVACPLFGLFLVYQLGIGKFDSAAIPVVATLASAMIGLPVWTRSDERARSDSNGDVRKRRRPRGVSIKWDDDDSSPGRDRD